MDIILNWLHAILHKGAVALFLLVLNAAGITPDTPYAYVLGGVWQSAGYQSVAAWLNVFGAQSRPPNIGDFDDAYRVASDRGISPQECYMVRGLWNRFVEDSIAGFSAELLTAIEDVNVAVPESAHGAYKGKTVSLVKLLGLKDSDPLLDIVIIRHEAINSAHLEQITREFSTLCTAFAHR